MKQPIIIIGAGGHARVLHNMLQEMGMKILGALSPQNQDHSTLKSGLTILGDDSKISEFSPAAIKLVNGIGSIDKPEKKRAIFDRYKGMGFHFANVIHPGAIIAPDAVLGEGVQIMAGAIIQPGCKLGENVLINTGAIIEHDCIIKSHVHVASGAILAGTVTVEENVHIGLGATVIQNIRVGANSFVGAGSVVIRDIHSDSRVAGVPAREMSR